ncbi:MAG: YceI family protein [Opitutales bacterium]
MVSFRLIACSFVLLAWNTGWGKTFDFNDPKGFNSIEFSLLGTIENGMLLGKISELNGLLEYDPKAPEKITGTITALTRSTKASVPEADAFLRGPSLFNVDHFPEINFTIKEAKNPRRIGNSVQLEVLGTLVIKDVNRSMTIPVRMNYLPGKLKARRGVEGDLLVIRSEFSIRRSDFDLGSGMFLKKVADEVKVELTLVGAAPKKATVPVNPRSKVGLLPPRSKSSRDRKRRPQRRLRRSSVPLR